MRRLYIILACLIFCITTYADVRNKLFYYTNPSTPFSYIFDVALVGGKADVIENQPSLFGVGKRTVLNRKFHSCHPPDLRISMMKKGAPMMAVRMETGISAGETVRAAVSTATINTAPRLMEAGMMDMLLLPNFMRQIWGISRPTQPT